MIENSHDIALEDHYFIQIQIDDLMIKMTSEWVKWRQRKEEVKVGSDQRQTTSTPSSLPSDASQLHMFMSCASQAGRQAGRQVSQENLQFCITFWLQGRRKEAKRRRAVKETCFISIFLICWWWRIHMESNSTFFSRTTVSSLVVAGQKKYLLSNHLDDAD